MLATVRTTKVGIAVPHYRRWPSPSPVKGVCMWGGSRRGQGGRTKEDGTDPPRASLSEVLTGWSLNQTVDTNVLLNME